jgi:hypothetical protein
MTQTVFLSTVSSEFGMLRQRLANLAQRTKKCLVRHQTDFFHRGVKTLQKSPSAPINPNRKQFLASNNV